MVFPAIARLRVETTLGDYAQMAVSLAGLTNRRKATARFERSFANFVGCRHAIAVASSQLGMHLVLKNLNVSARSEAIVPAFNLSSVIERFLGLGLRPVFADVDRKDLNIDPRDAESLVTDSTRVLLATHMYGNPCDMAELQALCEQKNLVLVEDCTHAFGSLHRGKHVGTFGRAGVFSFNPSMLVTAFGGGMITTNDDELAADIRTDLSDWSRRSTLLTGCTRMVKSAMLDFSMRKWTFSLGTWPMMRLARLIKPDLQRKIMTESPKRIVDWHPSKIAPLHAFQAILGRRQLVRAEKLISQRREVRAWYETALRDVPQVGVVRAKNANRPNELNFGLIAEQPERLCQHLFAKGIDTETSEFRNCADLPIYREFQRTCRSAREIERGILRLPNHPGLTRRHVGQIADYIKAYYETDFACAPLVPAT